MNCVFLNGFLLIFFNVHRGREMANTANSHRNLLIIIIILSIGRSIGMGKFSNSFFFFNLKIDVFV